MSNFPTFYWIGQPGTSEIKIDLSLPELSRIEAEISRIEADIEHAKKHPVRRGLYKSPRYLSRFGIFYTPAVCVYLERRPRFRMRIFKSNTGTRLVILSFAWLTVSIRVEGGAA